MKFNFLFFFGCDGSIKMANVDQNKRKAKLGRHITIKPRTVIDWAYLLLSWGTTQEFSNLMRSWTGGKWKWRCLWMLVVQSWPNLAKPDLTLRGKRNSVWRWKVRAFHCIYDKQYTPITSVLFFTFFFGRVATCSTLRLAKGFSMQGKNTLVLLQRNLSMKECSLFCFVVIRSTELGCFRSCSRCLGKLWMRRASAWSCDLWTCGAQVLKYWIFFTEN